MNKDFYAASLQYLERGWSIIPIAAGTKKPPWQFRWKAFQARQPTPDELRRWFDGRDDLGLAVILGEVSGGLVARDFDILDAYRRWQQQRPALAASLPTVATGRGRHVYFLSETRGILRQPDGELRAGGYCLLPPSRHPSGLVYEWLIPLPTGDLPRIDDLATAGLVTPCNRSNSLFSLLQGTGGENLLQTLPTSIGHRHRQVFELARALKALPDFAGAKAADLEPIVRQWHREGVARGGIGTREFEETWIDFLHGWPRVRYPRGAEPMAAILERAKRRVPKVAERYESQGVRLLVALCH